MRDDLTRTKIGEIDRALAIIHGLEEMLVRQHSPLDIPTMMLLKGYLDDLRTIVGSLEEKK